MIPNAWASGSCTDLKILLDHLVAYAQMPLAGPCVTEAASSQVDVVQAGHFVHLWIKYDIFRYPALLCWPGRVSDQCPNNKTIPGTGV